MPGSGSSVFTDADGYEASLRDLLALVVPQPLGFIARLTWADLPTIHLLRAQENTARVAYLRLPPNRVYIAFPSRRGSRLIAAGIAVEFGDFVFHSAGERLHQRTPGACNWAAISLPPASLLTYGRAVAGHDIDPPVAGPVLHVDGSDRQTLLRLHQHAGRLAERDLQTLAHHEIARGLEQDLILALINLITSGKPRPEQPRIRRYSQIMLRFEAMLDANPHGMLRMQDACAALDITQHVLRASSSEILGMAPMRHQRLRRLKLVRAALIHAGPSPIGGAEVLARYGFKSFHRFVTDYWNAYGEMPPVPPRRIAP